MITSDIFYDVNRIPLHTDLALKYHTSDTLREVYDTQTFHVYNLNSTEWAIQYTITDTRRDDQVMGTGLLCGVSGHITFEIPDGVREFNVKFTASGLTSANSGVTVPFSKAFETVQYVIRDPADYDIQTVYGRTQMLTEGLTPKRSQNIPTRGLAYNLDTPIETNFSLRPYTPQYIYDEPAWEELVKYFEEVLGSKFNITKQLNIFNTVFDDINLATAQKYGVHLDWIRSDYISSNILKNKEQIKSLYYLWSKKGNLDALKGALKLFCDVHPFESFKEETVGWTLTETSGGADYGLTDIYDVSLGSVDPSGDTEEDVYKDGIAFGANATETYYATDYKLPIKLNYFIDPWGVKQWFSQYDAPSAIIADYEYGGELVHALFNVTDNFTPVNAKVYYWWVYGGTNTRVNMYTSVVST